MLHQANLFLSIQKLPNELIKIIQKFIPTRVVIFCKKEWYIQHHKILRPLIPHFENCIRDIIRKDCYFVFKHIIEENYKRWMKLTKYTYKNTVYANYLYFLKEYCIEQDSTQCRNTLNIFLEESGLCKNSHKKNSIKSIRWRT